MRVEVLAVGTELLLGQIVDTNSAWIGEQLATAGLDCLYQAKVGDNHGRLVQALRDALSRADAVIVCGGLGPTPDDLSREALAEVLGVTLELDDELAVRIESMFSARGRVMPMNNLRQAEVPAGAVVIEQRLGTAPGLICELAPRSPSDGRKVVYAVPGVPYEMKEMIERAVLPDLARRAGEPAVILSRTLRTWGMTESGLAETIAARVDAQTNPTIAFLASGIEGIKVRITAKAPTTDAARELVDAEAAQLLDILGDVVFSANDEPMEAAVAHELTRLGLTLGVAESLTGGLVASRLVAVAGASEWFRGAVVAYDSSVKRSILGVDDGPVVSEAAAVQMARGVAAAVGSSVGLALTGVAGPDAAEGHAPGTVCIGWWLADTVGAADTADTAGAANARAALADGRSGAVTVSLPGDRERVRQYATITALDLLRRELRSS